MPDLMRCEVNDGFAVVTLTDPPMNLVSMKLTRELSQCLVDLRSDDSVGALVLTGSGDTAFCAGSDIKEFPELIGAGAFVDRKLAFENETFTRLREFPRPTIAALNGLAFGGGLELAACCDLIVAEETCTFALPEIRLGAIPGSGGTVRVVRRIGEGRGKEMALLGEPIDASTALSWGLVNRVVGKGGALTVARDMARAFAQGPREALAACKRCVEEGYSLAEQEAIERVVEHSRAIFASDDCREGVRAFLDKDRRPAFGGVRNTG